MSRTCSVVNCDGPHVAREMCNAHYLKWRASSDELPGKPCAVEDCHRPHASHGYCATHARHYRETGNPIATDGKGVNHARWNPDHTITYGGAHARVRRALGAPLVHSCVDCRGQAQEWAYDHLDDAEHAFASSKGSIPYSANPAHYMAMCKSCHTKFDRRHRAIAA